MKKLILISILFSTAAYAEFYSGNALYEKLQGSVVEQSVGLGYIVGVHDALRGVTHCSPTSVTAGQLTDMMKRHFEINPEVRNFSADMQVNYVLSKTWPCPKKGKDV